MESRGVSAVIVAIVLTLCVQVHFSAADEGEKPRKEITVELGDGITMKMVLIPAGEFMMGSPDSDEYAASREKPKHRVKIGKPYYLGVYEVRQSEYEKVMGDKPWSGKSYVKEGADYPATKVSWKDAQEFCRKLSTKEGRTYRLPTEAEWEYACRAGSNTAYCFGDSPDKLDDYSWSYANSGPYPVGEKRPNPWGLYDMHGNVWEWCSDWYDSAYYKNSPTEDPTGATSGSRRVYRGGCWNNNAKDCRSAIRGYFNPDETGFALGFRVALVPSE